VSIHYSISEHLDLAVFRWEGTVTTDEYFDALKRYTSDNHYKRGRTEFVDVSDLVDFEANFANMLGLIGKANREYDSRVCQTRVIVWSPNNMIFGIARMMQQLAEIDGGICVDVFLKEEEALSALDVNFSSVDQLHTAAMNWPPFRADTLA